MSFLRYLILFCFALSPEIFAQSSSPNPEELNRLKETLLKDQDPVRKGSAASQIIRLDQPEGMEFLRGLLREPKDAALVEAVLKAFSVAGNYSALEEMLILVSDERENIRSAALSSFQSMPDGGGRLSAEILRVISSPTSSEPIRRAAIVTAGKLGFLGSLEGISRHLDHEKFSSVAKEAANDITGVWFLDRAQFDVWWATRKNWTRERILEEAIRNTKRGEIETRLLWMKGDLDRHISTLADPSPELRKAAAAGIPSFRNDPMIGKAIEPLCRQLKNEFHLGAREAMLAALGTIGAGSNQARDLLLTALDSIYPRERRSAVRSLGNFANDPTVLPIFASIVRDWVEGRRSDEVEFRIDLLQALVRAGEPKGASFGLAAQIAKLLIHDPVDEVRKHAALALGVYGDRESMESLALAMDPSQEKAPNVRFNAANAMRQLGSRVQDMPAAIVYLHTFLKDPAYQNRKQGVDLLGEIRDPGSSELLLNLLGGEVDKDLRKAIFNAIGKIGQVAALDSLLKIDLREGDDRDVFFRTLDSLCGKDASRLLRTANECFARNESLWSVFLLEKMLALEGLDTNLLVQAEKTIVPAYRNVARELNGRSQAQPGPGADYLAKARLRLNHLRQVEPEQMEWTLALAEIEAELGEKENALQLYAELAPRAEKLSQGDPGLMRKTLEPYVILRIEKKEGPVALPYLLQLTTAFPGDRKLRERQAKLHRELKKIPEAIADYQAIREISRDDLESFWHATAELAELRLEFSNGETVLALLQGHPDRVSISAELVSRLKDLERRAREWYEFVGPLQEPLVPVQPGDKKN